MGKVLEFKPKGTPEPENNTLTVVGAEELRNLFNEEEVAGIKAELDFLDEMQKLGDKGELSEAQTDVVSGEES